LNAKDALRQTLAMSDRVVNSYVGDLDDADLLIRPHEGMNHIAWQLGHLISAERAFIESINPGASPTLPDGFTEAHSKEATTSDDRTQFRTKAEYLSLWKAQREATLAVLDAMSDEQFDAPSAERFRSFMPTVGAVFNLAGTHPLMHAGQWVGVRRKLKKPIVI